MLFAHFIVNEDDPLYALSDQACHAACVDGDPLGVSMLVRAKEYLNNSGPGKRICTVCGNEVHDPDDYLFIGYLADPSGNPLGKFNYTHLHKSHISNWKNVDEFLRLARAAVDAGQWGGKALLHIVQEIEAGRSTDVR